MTNTISYLKVKDPTRGTKAYIPVVDRWAYIDQVQNTAQKALDKANEILIIQTNSTLDEEKRLHDGDI